MVSASTLTSKSRIAAGFLAVKHARAFADGSARNRPGQGRENQPDFSLDLFPRGQGPTVRLLCPKGMEPRSLTYQGHNLARGAWLFFFLSENFPTHAEVDWLVMNSHVAIAQFQRPLTSCLSCFTWPTSPYIYSILCHYLWVHSGVPDIAASLFLTIFFHSTHSYLSSVIAVESLRKK